MAIRVQPKISSRNRVVAESCGTSGNFRGAQSFSGSPVLRLILGGVSFIVGAR